MCIFLASLIVFLNIFLLSVSCADTLSRIQPLTTSATYQALNIVYWHDFPYEEKTGNQRVKGCFFTHGTGSASGPSAVPVWRCKEQAHLLLPAATIDSLQKEQARSGYIKVNLPSGMHAAKAIITAVRPVSPVILKQLSLQKNADMVTSVFIRHSSDVRQYQFINERTKNTITINVTGNHRFYVQNRRAFVAVKKILPEDRLISDNGYTIRMLCSTHTANGCYKPYHPGQPVRVYNMEAGHRHTYFVGNIRVLVHNGCTRVNKKQYYDNGKKSLKYEGQMDAKTEKYDGYGELFDEDGWAIYKGYFLQGEYHYGTLYHENSERPAYLGDFLNGKMHGQGIQFSGLSSNKYVEYEGALIAGKRSGHGYEFFEEGGKMYDGLWCRDGRCGQGIEFYKTGKEKHNGLWLRNVPHGLGISYFRNSEVEFDGFWDHGKYKDRLGIVRRYRKSI